MDGVTILNTIVSNGNDEAGVLLATIGLSALILSMLITLIIIDICDEINIACKISMALSMISLILIFFGISLATSSTETTTYEVTISEDVSLTDFNSKYEIIKQRGKIYIVKERENNDR